MAMRRPPRRKPKPRSPATARKSARSKALSARRAPGQDASYRQRIVELLTGGHAHVTFADAIANFPPELRGQRPNGASHTPWQVLEHMRISQWDILEFSRDPAHVSPKFPDGYWPVEGAPPDGRARDRCVARFHADLEAMKQMVATPKLDLHSRIRHPEAKPHHTVAREALVLADHNSYHLGEMILLRRLLDAWPPAA